MGTPHLWIGDQEVEIRMPPIVRSPEPQRLVTTLDELAPLADLPLTVRLQWMGEKYPIYNSVTRGTAEVYFSSRVVFIEMTTSIRFWTPRVGRTPE